MAVPPLETHIEGQTDSHPLLMDHSENVGRHEHVIDVPRESVASSSVSHRGNHDDPNESHYVDGPTAGLPADLSGVLSAPTSASDSQNASFARRGDNHGHRHRSPLNSGLWISIELFVNVSQIIAAIVVLSISRDEHPRAPLSEWVIGYTVGCIATLPHLYWRYIHRNRHSSEQDSAESSQNSSQDSTPEPNSYVVISSAHTPEGENGTNNIGIARANLISASPRIHALVDYFKMTLDCFFALWFVVGNVWIFGGHSSVHDAPNLYRLCIVFLTFSCIGYAMPFILCAMICCCLPCIVSLMGFRDELNQNRGASPESISALPTHKFKPKGDGDGGGVLAAGTDKEQIISAEDAVCCICLSKYVDDDELRELPCMHFFHKECVDKWLKINALCPLCKAEVGSSTTSACGISFGRRHGDSRVRNDGESQGEQ